MKRFGLALATCGLLGLSGCGGLVAAGSVLGAAGALNTAIQAAQLTGDVLTDSAKLACAVQAAANASGDSSLSTAAGQFCKW